jgi:hypothetical protein
MPDFKLDGRSPQDPLIPDPVWHTAELCTARGAEGTIIRAEVKSDNPGANWLLSIHVGSEAIILAAGLEASIDAAKRAAWLAVRKQAAGML